jgi:hypothetical protein
MTAATKSETIDAFLGTDRRNWLADGESPARVAQALVDEMGPANGRDAEWTVDVLTEAIEEHAAKS